jgi:GNAT superfamily N-acetyltransferase
MSDDGIILRPVEIADLRTILRELDEFWGERDTAFLHQALYVHEFGDTSLLAERDREIVAYLLGFVSPADRAGYIHVVAVRRSARGRGLARLLRRAGRSLLAVGRREARLPARARDVLRVSAAGAAHQIARPR